MYDTKIQTPIQTKVLTKAKSRARDAGFSSVNDVIRILLKQFGEGAIDINLVSRATPNLEHMSEKEQEELEALLDNLTADDLKVGKVKTIRL